MTELSPAFVGPSEAAVVANLADHAASREVVTVVPDHVAVIVHRDDQNIEQFNLDEYAHYPQRKTAKVVLADADSFITYVGRHSAPRATTLWGDAEQGRIIAVLNDHERHPLDGETVEEGEDLPGWGDHRAQLTLKNTPDWDHWTKADGKLLPQAAFAEHLEDGAEAIRVPDAATMLEIAQSFHAKKGVSFASDKRLASGQVQLTYEETIKAKAGEKGTLEIPEMITLGLAPFEGNDPYEVLARFRYRIIDGNLAMGYKLIRPDRVRRAAFTDIVTAVSDGTGHPVMSGAPRA